MKGLIKLIEVRRSPGKWILRIDGVDFPAEVASAECAMRPHEMPKLTVTLLAERITIEDDLMGLKDEHT